MLNVYEAFHSISGEVGAVPQGTQMLFIRLAGCNLDCHYCDTAKAKDKHNGDLIANRKIEKWIIDTNVKNIMFTGGEPLLQEIEIIYFLKNFIKKYKDRKFHIETNGTIYPGYFLRKNCHFVFDYKVLYPDEMNIKPVLYESLLFKHTPYIKFVVGSVEQLNQALDQIRTIFQSCRKPPIFTIGKYGKGITEKEILHCLKVLKATNIIINTQIHKFLNLD